MKNYKTIDEYIDDQPERTKKALSTLKKCILKAAPNVKELFNYNIPAFSLVENGKRELQIMIAGYKNHVGFYPHPTTIEAFSERLNDYKHAKGSIQFTFDKPIPCELIIEMVQYRRNLIRDGKRTT